MTASQYNRARPLPLELMVPLVSNERNENAVIIPLISEGEDRTVVLRQEDFDVEGTAVLIADLDPEQLIAERKSNISYDLRIGKQCRDHHDDDPRDIPDGGVIPLHSGSAVIIQTEEWVHFPRTRFGIIAPRVLLLEQGLSTTFSKVDPGYDGRLLVTLFNLGQTTRTLRRGDPFCALSVLRVDSGARLYDKGAKQISARPATQPRRRFPDFL